MRTLRGIIAGIDDHLQCFSWPLFDEDYKVERRSDLTEDAFDRVEQLANEFADRVEHLLPI